MKNNVMKSSDLSIDIEELYLDIKDKILSARSKMLKSIDTTMVEVYWYVGKNTYELSESSTKASYGKKIIKDHLCLKEKTLLHLRKSIFQLRTNP